MNAECVVCHAIFEVGRYTKTCSAECSAENKRRYSNRAREIAVQEQERARVREMSRFLCGRWGAK